MKGSPVKVRCEGCTQFYYITPWTAKYGKSEHLCLTCRCSKGGRTGDKSPPRALDAAKVEEIRAKYAGGLKSGALARIYGVNDETILRVVKRRGAYKDVDYKGLNYGPLIHDEVQPEVKTPKG